MVGKGISGLRYGHDVSRYNHDTVGMVVLDGDGNMASGTSTNGVSHKIPGYATLTPGLRRLCAFNISIF